MKYLVKYARPGFSMETRIFDSTEKLADTLLTYYPTCRVFSIEEIHQVPLEEVLDRIKDIRLEKISSDTKAAQDNLGRRINQIKALIND